MKNALKKNVPLAPYTTWHVGGVADIFYEPADLNDLIYFLKNYPDKKTPITWLGGGSKVLIRDGGIRGIVLHTCGNLASIELLPSDIIRIEAGATCAQLIQFCLEHGFVDMAFLTDIPGTIGGALTMNAGAFGKSIWQHVTQVETINRNGEIKNRAATEFHTGYRMGGKLDVDEWFIAAHLKFNKGDVAAAKQKIQIILEQRHAKQPWNEHSCGSVFKNPPNASAGRLVEASGLKGKTDSKAYVSPKHANFIINPKDASAAQIEELIFLIRDKVKKQTGITLELEAQIIGEKLHG